MQRQTDILLLGNDIHQTLKNTVTKERLNDTGTDTTISQSQF